MSIKNRNKVHVRVTIYCHNLSIQMALLFSKAESKSYAVVPMMLFSLKHFRAPFWEFSLYSCCHHAQNFCSYAPVRKVANGILKAKSLLVTFSENGGWLPWWVLCEPWRCDEHLGSCQSITW